MNEVNELCSQLKKLKGKLAKQDDKGVIDRTIRKLKGKSEQGTPGEELPRHLPPTVNVPPTDKCKSCTSKGNGGICGQCL